jgi:hypothetical protein
MLTLFRRIWQFIRDVWQSVRDDMNEPSAPYPADPEEWREAMERQAQEQAEYEQAKGLTRRN